MALAKKCDICGKLYETYNFRKKPDRTQRYYARERMH